MSKTIWEEYLRTNLKKHKIQSATSNPEFPYFWPITNVNAVTCWKCCEALSSAIWTTKPSGAYLENCLQQEVEGVDWSI